MAIKRRFKLLGDEKMIQKLQEIGVDVSSELIDVLMEAAQPIKEDAAANAPRGTGESRKRQGIEGPLAESIIAVDLSEAQGTGAIGLRGKIEGTNNAGVAIGPDIEHYYGVFVEEGSIRHTPNPFLEPAFQSNRKNAERLIAQEIREIIARHTAG